MNFETRGVSLSELDDVLNLIDQFDRVKAPRPTVDQVTTIYSNLVRSGGCVVGRFYNGKVIGTCTVNLCSNFSWSGRPFAIIENVIVDSGFRRQGIGTNILEFAIQYAEAKGCYKVVLMTGSKLPETLEFYESVGLSATKTGFQKRFDS